MPVYKYWQWPIKDPQLALYHYVKCAGNIIQCFMMIMIIFHIIRCKKNHIWDCKFRFSFSYKHNKHNYIFIYILYFIPPPNTAVVREVHIVRHVYPTWVTPSDVSDQDINNDDINLSRSYCPRVLRSEELTVLVFQDQESVTSMCNILLDPECDLLMVITSGVMVIVQLICRKSLLRYMDCSNTAFKHPLLKGKTCFPRNVTSNGGRACVTKRSVIVM